MTITFDGSLDIATGRSRRETHWKNRELTWSQLLQKLSKTHRTAEKIGEYLKAAPARQDEIKDIGGFVGGVINGGHRKAGSIVSRCLVSLDLDFAPDAAVIWDKVVLIIGAAAAMYSTHKHTPEAPRLRLLFPLTRPVSVDEYEAIARMLASDIGMDYHDPTTFQPSRLMYWPSTSTDGEYLFHYNDSDWTNPDDILARYKDWTNAADWPVCSKETEKVRTAVSVQADPLTKPGLIGAFCRAYGIAEAIETFLPEIYEPAADGRFTYKGGSTAGGLVLYENKFAYSHHSTDPCSGILCNAFDLVRIHKFGNKDGSLQAMQDFAATDFNTCKVIGIERFESAIEDFGEVETQSDEWLGELERDKKGTALGTINNTFLVLNNDPRLKGRFALDQFEHREIALMDLPWRKVTYKTRYILDSDDAGLRHYLEVAYGITGAPKIKDAMDLTVRKNTFHPICDYIRGLSWDGVDRIDTLLIDYLGAEDSPYTRAVTRKSIVSAVARVFDPGVKFDYMLVLVGEQGIGKSTWIAKLGGKWFSDSFNFHMLNNPKHAEEQLQGAWLVEVGELTGLSKADVEAAKSFLSRTEDRYRIPYGKRIDYFPRQCVFFGSTNVDEPLRDTTGNRRFWPVACEVNEPTKNIFKGLSIGEVNQIWAEAYNYYKTGEPLYLDAKLSKIAAQVAAGHTEKDDRLAPILKFLDLLLPASWEEMPVQRRREWLNEDETIREKGTTKRTVICVAEIWVELFNGNPRDMTRNNTKFIHDILRQLKGWKPSKGQRTRPFYGQHRAYERA